MKIVMKQSTRGSSNPHGTETMMYEAAVEYDMSAPWQAEIGQVFIDNDLADSISEKKKAAPKKRTAKKSD